MAILNPKRYDKQSYLDIEYDLTYDYLGNNFIKILRDSASNLSTYTVKYEECYRIDLITKRIYGRSDLFWIILDFNNILFMEQLTTDCELQVPSLVDIESAIRKFRNL